MNSIKLLDCTLRDGGYCNEWHFGFQNSGKIIRGLVDAGIEIIECGFLTDRVSYDSDFTKFTSISQVKGILPANHEGRDFVLMMNFGEYDPDNIPDFDGSSVNGIRVAFHKKNMNEALELCSRIKAKGYKVFIQAMVSLIYSDREFLELIERANELEPYAFYIVDSFGTMNAKDLTRLFYMVEHNLRDNISVGFHSHNNLQLSYSNAQKLIDIHTQRDLIIDCSVYGMGRGAGNLNTELFVDYLNSRAGKNYALTPLLGIIDEILEGFYQRSHWGYSLPNYLSAVHGAHPNYASYLSDKNTLTVKEMNEIFDELDPVKKLSYDKKYIEQVYLDYMSKSSYPHDTDLKEKLSDRTILLIAPGKSSFTEREAVISFAAHHDCAAISINFEYEYLEPDFIFLSNLRRLRELDRSKLGKCIVTSNITAEGVYYRAEYGSLVFPEEAVRDNAGLMAIRFLGRLGVKEIYLAGFDGYSHDTEENYGNSSMTFTLSRRFLEASNMYMNKVLKRLSEEVPVHFLTRPAYLRL